MAFEGLSDKLQKAFKKLTGKGKLNEQNIKDAMREVRMALLEADVNYLVVKDFDACFGILADVQDGTTEVVVALEHRHFVFAVTNRLYEFTGVAGNRQKGGKVVFVGEVFVAGAYVCDAAISIRAQYIRNLVDREKRPQFVIATRHSQLFNAGNGVH
nr:signal recognition particle receptor subunit alpha [uncultured Fibrobacter sp.]